MDIINKWSQDKPFHIALCENNLNSDWYHLYRIMKQPLQSSILSNKKQETIILIISESEIHSFCIVFGIN